MAEVGRNPTLLLMQDHLEPAEWKYTFIWVFEQNQKKLFENMTLQLNCDKKVRLL